MPALASTDESTLHQNPEENPENNNANTDIFNTGIRSSSPHEKHTHYLKTLSLLSKRTSLLQVYSANLYAHVLDD
jgi:hypothetical protein